MTKCSWEGCSTATIQAITTQVSVTDNIWRAPIRITSFPHYVAVICCFIESWHKKDMQATDFLVGKFTIQMRPNDPYCCPVKKDEQDINLHDKRLSYATLKTSRCFSKKYSETVWLYMNGNRDKVDCYIQTPQDAIALCAVLFSEVIRYPDMFFFTTSSWCSTWNHGRSFMTIIPCWQEDHGKVDQASRAKWLFQKRLNREKKKKLFSCFQENHEP